MLDTHGIIRVLRLTQARYIDAARDLLYHNHARSVGLCESKQPHSAIERAFRVTSEGFMFYVYVLTRSNNAPFYVGKGKDNRVFRHEIEARNGCKCHKCRVIRKIWRQGGEVQRYVVFTTVNEEDAYQYEAEMIEMIGRKNLTNLIDGGRAVGLSAVDTEPKRLERLRASANTPEGKAQRSAAARARWADPEFKAKVRQSIKDKWASDPNRSERIARANAARFTPEAMEKMRSAASARWDSPEYRTRFQGENNANAKLTWEKVRVIRTRYAAGGESTNTLAREFGVTQGVIWSVVNNRTWKE